MERTACRSRTASARPVAHGGGAAAIGERVSTKAPVETLARSLSVMVANLRRFEPSGIPDAAKMQCHSRPLSPFCPEDKPGVVFLDACIGQGAQWPCRCCISLRRRI